MPKTEAGRADPFFKLRLPADMRSKLEEAATKHHRSITAEILLRLQETMAEHPDLNEVKGMTAALIKPAPANHILFSVTDNLLKIHDQADCRASVKILVAETMKDLFDYALTHSSVEGGTH